MNGKWGVPSVSIKGEGQRKEISKCNIKEEKCER